MDIASVFAWFAQESLSIAEQANEPKQRQTFTQLALLWATAAQQCSGGAKLASAWREDAEALKRGEKLQPASAPRKAKAFGRRAEGEPGPAPIQPRRNTV